MRLGIIGGGRAAWAFGSSWQSSGAELAGVLLRPDSRSDIAELLAIERLDEETLLGRCDVLLVAVRDDALAEVAARIGAAAPAGVALFHSSGSVPSSVFGERDVRFSLHPFRALPPVGQPVSLRDTLLVFEGTAVARAIADRFADRIGSRIEAIRSEQKTLYHAGAVIAANYVATLLETSASLLKRAGLEPQSFHSDLAALARSAIGNWERGEGVARFTGPLVRGDFATVAEHLSVLEGDPATSALYRELAIRLTEILEELSPERSDLRELREALHDGLSHERLAAIGTQNASRVP